MKPETTKPAKTAGQRLATASAWLMTSWGTMVYVALLGAACWLLLWYVEPLPF